MLTAYCSSSTKTCNPSVIRCQGKIKQQTSFDYMKRDDFSNLHEIQELGSFFINGQVGSWKDRFTVAQSEQFNRIFAKRMQVSGPGFGFE